VPSDDEMPMRALLPRTQPTTEARRPIELIVAGMRQPVCAPNRVLLDSGRLWSGYRLEAFRAPAR